MGVVQRLNQFIEIKGISKYKFYKKTGLSNGALDKGDNLGSDKCEKIHYAFPEINLEWLLTGQGEMLIGTEVPTSTPQLSNRSAESSIYYNMYKEKDEEVKALLIENATLKERLRAQEKKRMGVQQDIPPDTPKDSSGSAQILKSGVIDSGSALCVDQ